MIALDTNFLVHVERAEMQHHEAARRMIVELAESGKSWAIPWACVYEYLRVVTHPRIFSPPTDLREALDGLEIILQSPTLAMLGDGPNHRHYMRPALEGAAARGNLVHDAHIAALLAEHGVTEFWTLDRDFQRFPGIKARNPFTA